MRIKKLLAALVIIAATSATALAGEIDLPGSPQPPTTTSTVIVWILTGQII